MANPLARHANGRREHLRVQIWLSARPEAARAGALPRLVRALTEHFTTDGLLIRESGPIDYRGRRRRWRGCGNPDRAWA